MIKKSYVKDAGEKLGIWVHTQRQVGNGTAKRKGKMTFDRVKKLDDIGMLW